MDIIDETIRLQDNVSIIVKNNFTQNYNGRVNRDDLDGSDIRHIKYVMIHYTVICEWCTLDIFRNSQVSAHYVITKNGTILNIVPDRFRAWHAGVGNLEYPSLLNEQIENIANDMNSYSIGIEIVNSGYEEYTQEQKVALYQLLKRLNKLYNISPINVIGHNIWSVGRKIDPGVYWQDLRDYIWQQQKIENINILPEYGINNIQESSQKFINLDKEEQQLLNKQFIQLGIKYSYNYNQQNLIYAFKLFYSYPKLYEKAQLTQWSKLDQQILDILCHNVK